MPKKRRMILAASTALLLVILALNAGIASAGDVEEHGDLNVELVPDIDDLTYVIGDDVVYNTDFSSSGHWELTEDFDVSDEFTAVISGRSLVFPDEYSAESPTAILDAEDAPQLTSTNQRYYEARFFVTDPDTDVELSFTGQDGVSLYFDVGDGEFTALGDTETGLEVDGWTYYRLGLAMDDDGSATARLLDDNYNTLAAHSSMDSMRCSDVETVEIDSYLGSEWKYFFASDGSQPMSEQKEPDFENISWNPTSTEDERLYIDYERQDHYGLSSDESTQNALGVDDKELAHYTHIEEFSADDAVDYLAQTPEEDEERYEDRRGHWQGWGNIRDYIEVKIFDMLGAEYNVDWDMVEIIRYDISDIELYCMFDESVTEELRDVYAETLLTTAKEEGWLIRSNVTGGHWEKIEDISRYKEDVLNDHYEIDTMVEIGDIRSYFQDIVQEVKQDSLTQFTIYPHTTADLAREFSMSSNDVFGVYGDMAYSFQASNLVLAQVMSEGGLDAMDYDDNTLSVSLSTLQEEVYDETLYFHEDESGERTGLPAQRPLTVGTYYPTTSHVFILALIVVGIIMVGAVLMWRAGSVSKDGRDKKVRK